MTKANPNAAKVKTVKMISAEGKTADVHPDMVDEYKAGGFVAVKSPRKPSKTKAK